jgi:hypothetical protein
MPGTHTEFDHGNARQNRADNERWTAMKRSFQVATIFTGAAACAVALAPAAGAAPLTPGNTARITPDTTARNCTSTFTSSVVLYYTPSENHSKNACVKGIGFVYLGQGKRFTAYCAGAYSGFFYINGNRRSFTEGSHPLYSQAVSAISITKDKHPQLQCSAAPR